MVSSVSRAVRRSTRRDAKVDVVHRLSGPTKWASAARKPEGPGEFAPNPSGFGSIDAPHRPSPNPLTLPQILSGRTTKPNLILL